MARRFFSKIQISTNIVLVIFVAGIILITLSIGLITTSGHLSRAYAAATSHQPERYSELYFNNLSKLPSYSATGKQQTISFHITNHEARETTYQVKVTVTIGDTLITSLSTVTLKDSQGTDMLITYTIPKPKTAALVQVRLVGSNEQLEFRSTS